MKRNERAFTLVEIAIAVFIMLLLVMLAVPSLNGVLADRRLQRSLDSVSGLARTAQQRAVIERRPYLIVWDEGRLVLRPESLRKGEEKAAPEILKLDRGDTLLLRLPVALVEEPPPAWIFWPSGTCEPAEITFKGRDGSWVARFSPLTVTPEVLSYAVS